MSFAKRNTLPEFTYRAPADLEFSKLADIVLEDTANIDKVHVLRALHLNDRGDYGDTFVAITDTHKINLPGHLTRMLRPIVRSERDVREINEGKVGFTIVSYENEHGTHFTIKWADVNPPQPAQPREPAEVDI